MLSASEISLLAAELDEVLQGGRLQKVHGPRDATFTFQIHRDGTNHTVLAVLDRPYPRVHLATASFENPSTPPPLVTTLRQELANARVERVTSPTTEKLVTFSLRRLRDDRPEGVRLVLELFGRCNLLLVDDRDRVLCALREGGRGGVRRGGTYAPPARRGEAPPAGAPPFEFLGTTTDGAWSASLESWVTPLEAEHAENDQRTQLLSALRRRLKKERRLEEKLERELAQIARAPELRRFGELLKQNLSQVKKGAREVVLVDYASGAPEEVTVPLDPKTAPLEMMERYFKDAKKLERGTNRTAERAANVKERVAAFAELQEKAEATTDPVLLAALVDTARAAGILPKDDAPKPAPKKRAEPEKRKPYRTFTSADGLEILVGRTSADNDELTFRVARGNDYWLHVADHPGSHVVIRAQGELPKETLLDAATLAVHFSRIQGASRCEVSWTQRKHVSKFRGARPGQVQLSERKSIRVRVEPSRLDRLLNRGLDA